MNMKEKKMAAMARRLLRVNLSTGKSEVEEIPQRVVENCMGGRGFGADYMYREMSPSSTSGKD
jgi:aldehyde:ferredoxin oxidoreductase